MAKSSRVKAYINKDNNSGNDKPSRAFLYLIGVVLLFAVVSVGAYLWLENQFDADGPVAEPVVFEVPRGAGVSRVAANLERDGLIRNADLFKVMVRLE